MVSRSQSSTPIPIDENHPIHNLTIGDTDQTLQLSKLHPIYLLNQIDTSEGGFQTDELINLRNEIKGYIKLQSELFDVDLFELELLGFFPRDDDRLVLFLNKLKLGLISAAKGSKVSDVDSFETVFRSIFGINTVLGGIEKQEEEEDNDVINLDNEEEGLPKFDFLTISEKFEVLYILTSYVSKYSKFRDWIEKQGLLLDHLRFNPVFVPYSETNIQDEYVLLCDDTRLYKRTVTYNSLVIPKKRKFAPESPQNFYKPENFDIKSIKFELIYKNIYEFNDYLQKLKKSTKFKPLLKKISSKAIIDAVFENEIKKRKFLINKKKEIQMVSLLAVRKRSSRLEAKQKQRQEELQRQKDDDLKYAAERRFERRMKLKLSGSNVGNMNTSNLSRDERLKLRKLQNSVESPSVTATPEPEETPEVVPEETPEVVPEETPEVEEVVPEETPEIEEISAPQQTNLS
ncbi:hypothetical protein SBY92_004342 [Candida maltosa Xu316]